MLSSTAPGYPWGPPGTNTLLLAVLIIPLVDKNSGSVVCVILVSAGTWAGLWGQGLDMRVLTSLLLQVHCGQLSDSDEQNLRALEKHVSDSF